MFYTGKQRLNKNILGQQNKSTQKNEKSWKISYFVKGYGTSMDFHKKT